MNGEQILGTKMPPTRKHLMLIIFTFREEISHGSIWSNGTKHAFVRSHKLFLFQMNFHTIFHLTNRAKE